MTKDDDPTRREGLPYLTIDISSERIRKALNSISIAIKKRQTVSFEWSSGLPSPFPGIAIGIIGVPIIKRKPIPRIVDPYTIYPNDNSYFIGYWHEMKKIQAFSLSETANIKLMLKHFTIPVDFNAEEYFDKNVNEFASTQSMYSVELLLDKEIGVSVRQWEKTQEIKESNDGSVYVKFATNDIPKVLEWVRAHGNAVKVLRPVVLVKMAQIKV